EQWCPKRALVDKISVRVFAMLAEAFAMIGGQHDQRLIGETLRSEGLPEPAELFVDVADLRVVAVAVGLMHIVEMDEDKERMIGIPGEPFRCDTQDSLRRPPQLRSLLADEGVNATGAGIESEAVVLIEGGIEDACT